MHASGRENAFRIVRAEPQNREACIWCPMQAYTQAFTPSDNVTLIIQSCEEKNFWDGLQDATNSILRPAVFFVKVVAALKFCLSSLFLAWVWVTNVLMSKHTSCSRCAGNSVLNAFQGIITASNCTQGLGRLAGNMKQLLPLQECLSHAEMLRLYHSAQAYIISSSSKAFDLWTLEAVAMGLQACYQECLACTFDDANSGTPSIS